MRINGRLNLLSTMLLCLGAVPLPSPRKEENLAEAEQVMRDLQAAEISPGELVAAVGPDDFVAMGRAILAVHQQLLSTGTRETSVTKLLGIFNAYIQPKPVDIMGDLNHLSFAKPMEKFDPLTHTGRGVKYPEPTIEDMFADKSDPIVAAAMQKYAASFGEPVDSKDLAGGAGKSFEPDQPAVFLGIDMAAPERTVICERVGPQTNGRYRLHEPRYNPPFAQADAFKARVAKLGNRIPFPDTTAAQIGTAIRASIDRASTVIRQPRDRPEQLAAKKTRARAKASRGW